MRCLLATGLPGRATFGNVAKPEPAVVRDGGFEGANMMENGNAEGCMRHAGHVVGPPRVSLDLDRPVSFSPSEYVEIMLSPIRTVGMTGRREASGGAEGATVQERSPEIVDKEGKGEKVDSVLDQRREDGHVVEPMAEGFGRGEGMARMYC